MEIETFTVRVSLMNSVLASLVSSGIDGDAVLRDAGLERAALDAPGARFPEASLLALWLAAEQRSGLDQLGLLAGTRLPIGAFGVLDYYAGVAPTIGDALRRITAYSGVVGTGVTFVVDARPAGDVTITMTHPYALEFLPRTFVEYLWTVVVTRVREWIDARFRPTVLFAHAPVGPRETYDRVLGDVVFRADCAALRISRAQWDLPNPQAEADVSILLEGYARAWAERDPARPLQRVRAALADALRAGDASVDRVAERLGVSVRTLQRELASANYSYTRARDEVRADLARAYLASREIPLAEVGCRLGYSDPSAFHRAFRRWAGMTPLEYRRAAEAGAHAPPGERPGR